MREHITEVADLAPRNLGMARLDYLGEVARSVGERLQSTEYSILRLSVTVKEIRSEAPSAPARYCWISSMLSEMC